MTAARITDNQYESHKLTVTIAAPAPADDYVAEEDYLTFTAEEAGSSVTLNYATGTLQYKENNSDWQSYTVGTPIELASAGDSVRFRGKDTTFNYSNHVSIGGKVACSGDIRTLLDYADPESSFMTYGCFSYMFCDCTSLTAAPELPATTLAYYCYSYMFSGCTGLTSAPELPATSLEEGCYFNMFGGCTGLTAAPELPATTLAYYCYSYMFSGCTGLTAAPELPATTLEESCYSCMFSGCTGLTAAPELPATALSSYCYSAMFCVCTGLTLAPELPATSLEEGCYNDMFAGCTGLTAAPKLPATTLAYYCYSYMFSGCTGLTEAPELPATSLEEGCYQDMFDGCTGLTAAPELPATTLADYCYCNMFSGCTGLTEAPELPATALAAYCYDDMFRNCTSLTTAPELPATTLAYYCYSYMFIGCTGLTSAPELPATRLEEGCYNDMFYGCTGIKLSIEQNDEYNTAYSLPKEGTGTDVDNAMDGMFAYTGGTFKGTPEFNTTYYMHKDTPAHTHNGVTFDPWTSTDSLPASGDYYLTADVTVSSMTVIHDGSTLNLCLNGHSILMTGNDGVFTVKSNAVMNLYDCDGSNGVHYVTLENWRGTAVSGSGEAASVTNGNGTVEVTGGLITGGYAGNPGGGAFRVDGTFAMYGGTLIGNYAQYDKTKGSGGAVWSSGTTTIAGNSRITCNKGTDGDRGGVYISNGTFNISGTPDLTGNSGRDLVINGNSRKINFIDIDFDPAVRLGVIYYTGNPSDIEITTNANFADDAAVQAAMQHSNAGRSIVCYKGQAKIVNAYTVTWKNGNDVLETDENVAEGTMPEYNGNTPEKAEDENNTYTFAGWSPEITAVTGDITYTATYTETAKPKKLFPQHSITLGGNIGVNFYIDSAAADFANASTAVVKFTWDNGNYNEEVDLKELTPDGDGYYKATVDVVAAQMAHKIHAEVYLDGVKLDQTDDYSVQDYAETVFANPEKYDSEKPEQLKALAKALLNYGAMAQTVFATSLNEHPELANTVVGNNGYSAVTAEQIGEAINGEASDLNAIAEQLGAKYYTNSLIYLSKNTLRIYFTPTSYPGEIPNAGAYDGNLSGYYYYVDHANIPAAELDNQQIFTVGGTEFTFSALDYAKAVVESTKMKPEQQNLAKSLYLYNQAANAYFG